MNNDEISETGSGDGGTIETRDPGSSGVTAPDGGIPMQVTLQGTLGRFLPASLLSTGLTLAGLGFLSGSSVLELGLVALLASGVLTIGFGAGLEGLRRWLPRDAGVEGRRSVLAGLLSPLATFIFAVLHGGFGVVGGSLWLFLVGMVLAVVMFFPWLATDPEEDPAGPSSSDERLISSAATSRGS
jgi:hypothetical protein